MQPLRISRKPILPAIVDAEIARVLSKILAACSPRAVYLFGSAATGQMTDQSDLDIIVVLPDGVSPRPAQQNLRHHQPLSQHGVDLVWISDSEFERKKALGGICMVAASEGRLLYQSSDN
jgi:predicted nucleotidyltransferase